MLKNEFSIYFCFMETVAVLIIAILEFFNNSKIQNRSFAKENDESI
ncbi:hypothetical protein LEP1GSC072_1400 [Leptospira noguchii str. Bonito]|nr:hypothetical protein LEP1GSC072_1400 [Leptospira noguchii str. Bonito]